MKIFIQKSPLLVVLVAMLFFNPVRCLANNNVDPLLRDADIKYLSLSPNGESIAYFSRTETLSSQSGMVEILDTRTGERKEVFGTGNEEILINAISWLSDDVLTIRAKKNSDGSGFHPIFYYVKTGKFKTLWEGGFSQHLSDGPNYIQYFLTTPIMSSFSETAIFIK